MRFRSRRPLGAAIAALGLLVACARADEARLVDVYTWPRESHGYGGFSGIDLSDDGMHFTAISDRAALITGTFRRKDGKIVGIQPDPVRPLLNTRGRLMEVGFGDSEGLAVGPDGHFYISFEGMGRVWAYETPDRATALPRDPAFDALQTNAGFEALAIDDRGRLFTLPERSGELTEPFPVWRFDGTGWSQPFSIPRRGGFLAVGADFGPDGRFYLLEREFPGYGFRSRVRRFEISETAVLSEETLFESPVWRFDNLEGLAVWRDADGTIRLTMISDDNFNPLQRTEIVEFTVPESLASQGGTP